MKPYYLFALLGLAAAYPTDLIVYRDTQDTEIEEQGSAVEWVAAIATSVGAAGQTVVAVSAGVGVYHAVAKLLKNDSQKDQCSFSYLTKENDNGHGYTYAYISSATTGNNCDTTAGESQIETALDNCANDLHRHKASAGCCSFRHGNGTWRGFVKLARTDVDFDKISCGQI